MPIKRITAGLTIVTTLLLFGCGGGGGGGSPPLSWMTSPEYRWTAPESREIASAPSPVSAGIGVMWRFNRLPATWWRGITTAVMIFMFTTPSPRRLPEYRLTAPGPREIVPAPSPASAGMGVMWSLHRLPTTWWRGIPTAGVISMFTTPSPRRLPEYRWTAPGSK
jgi:hypothetical protein